MCKIKRKVVKHGSATLTVSLPSEWAKKFGIRAGDEIDIEEERGKLVVSCEKDIESVREATLNIEDWGILGGRCIGALFKGGCDVINIHFDHPSSMAVIEKNLRELIGFEIMHQSEKRVLIKEVSNPVKEMEVEEMIKRTFLLLISIANDFFECSTKEDNDEIMKNLIQRDYAVNKFCNFCRRLMNKKGAPRINEIGMVYYIVEEIEKIGDEYKHLASYLLRKNIRLKDENVISIIKSANQLLNDFFTVYFKFNNERAKKLAEDGQRIIEKVDMLFESKKSYDLRVLDTPIRISGIIINMLGPLLTWKLPQQCTNDST